MDSLLPEGWEVRKLGEILDFFNGFAFKSKDSIETSNTKLIRMGNLYQNKLNLERKTAYYPDIFISTYSKYLLKENDLIISLTGTAGKEDYGYTVKIPKTNYNLLLNQRIAKIIIKDEKKIVKDYLFHFLLSRTFLELLYKTANGTRQANLSTETMKNISISIPTPIEQKKIVATLDEAFSAIDKAKANAELNLQNAKELFESYLQDMFENRGEGWEEKNLGEVCEMVKRGISPKYHENEGIIVLNQKCIRDHKICFKKSRLHDNITKKVNPERIIKLGDVLINSTGTGTLGRVAQVKDNFKNVIVDSHITIVRPLADLFFINFFGWALIYIEDKITNSGAGCGGQTELARDKLENDFKICFPNSKTEQKTIVNKLDALSEQTKKLEAIYTQKIRDLDELKKAILQKAFSGELR